MLVLVPISQVLLFIYAMGSPIGGMPMIIINEDLGQFGSQYLSFLNPDIIVQVICLLNSEFVACKLKKNCRKV